MRKMYLFLPVFILASLFINSGCLERANTIMVIPGKSIGKVELGMTEKQVIGILGKPSEVIFPSALMKDLRTGETRLPTNEDSKLFGWGQVKMLLFSKPRLDVILDLNSKVRMIRLLNSAGYSVSVIGYPSLKAHNLQKYLSLDEVKSLGKPSSYLRDELAENELSFPKGIVVEYYEYYFEEGALRLGFIFNKTMKKKNKYYIAIGHIIVCERTP